MSFKEVLQSWDWENKNNPTQKTFSNNLYKMDMKKLKQKIDSLRNCFKEYETREISLRNEENEAITFSIVKTDNENFSIYRKEEAIERVIVCSDKNKFYNQITLTNGKENIDLIEIQDNKVIIYELKAENGSDSPIFALIELLKNYELFKKAKKLDEKLKNKEIELVILAPKEYYDIYFKNEKVKEKFQELLNLFDEKISLKTINFNSDDVLDKLQDKIDEEGWDKPSKETKQYDEIKKVEDKIVIQVSKELNPKIEIYQ